MATRRRLDTELVRRGLVPSREAARREIEARRVLVGGAFADKPARMVEAAQSIELTGPPPPFVSRAGLKLAAALEAFAVDPSGMACVDAGSSTGGFTDCLLQNGAASVLAVDVGTNQLHERMRADSRVEVREQTDIRSLSVQHLNDDVELVVGDLSFISLRLVLPTVAELLAGSGSAVLLVKPQFEAGRDEVSKGRGIITDPEIWRRVLLDVLGWADDVGLRFVGLVSSPITGAKGNVEFIVHLIAGGGTSLDRSASETLVDNVVMQIDTEEGATDG